MGRSAPKWSLLCLTVAVVAAGIYLAYEKYGKAGTTIAEPAVGNRLQQLSLNKFYVDEFYDLVLVRPFTAISEFLCSFYRSVGDRWRGQWRGRDDARLQHVWRAFADRQRAALRGDVFGRRAGAASLLPRSVVNMDAAHGFGDLTLLLAIPVIGAAIVSVFAPASNA